MCSICIRSPAKKKKKGRYLKPWRQLGFSISSQDFCGKWHGTFNTSVLTHIYEHALSSLKGAKLISALAFLRAEKCTSNVCCFHYFLQCRVKTAQSELKCVNHAFYAGCITNHKLYSTQSLQLELFSWETFETPEGIWGSWWAGEGNSLVNSPHRT